MVGLILGASLLVSAEPDLSELLAQLGSSETEVVRLALESAEEVETELELSGPLLQLTAHQEPSIRSLALKRIADHHEGWKHIYNWLYNRYPESRGAEKGRSEAYSALSEGIADSIEACLSDDITPVRIEAARTMARLGPDPEWIWRKSHGLSTRSSWASERLMNLQPGELALFRPLLSDPDLRVRVNAHMALNAAGVDLSQQINRLYQSRDASDRALAMNLDEAFVPSGRFLAALQDSDPEVVKLAFRIGGINSRVHSESLVPQFERLPASTQEALLICWQDATVFSSSTPTIRSQLYTSRAEEQAAIKSMFEVGIASPNPAVRLEAFNFLRYGTLLGDRSLCLQLLANDPDARVRAYALMEAVDQWKFDAPRILVEALRDSASMVRRTAMDRLIKLDPELAWEHAIAWHGREVRDGLDYFYVGSLHKLLVDRLTTKPESILELTSTQNKGVQHALLWAISEKGATGADPFILKMMEAKDWPLRYQAAKAAVKCRMKEALPLAAQVIEESSHSEQLQLIESLRGMAVPEAANLLMPLRKKGPLRVAIAAEWALEAYGIR